MTGFDSTGMAQGGSENRYSKRRKRRRRPPWGGDVHTDTCEMQQSAGWVQRGEGNPSPGGTQLKLGIGVSSVRRWAWRKQRLLVKQLSSAVKLMKMATHVPPYNAMWPWSRSVVHRATLSQHYVSTVLNPGGSQNHRWWFLKPPRNSKPTG